jgi:hypothetical protein
VGVGASARILGKIKRLPIRIGPVLFDNSVSVLADRDGLHPQVDFLIGLDFLKRFNCEISLKDRVLRVFVNSKRVCLPFFSDVAQLRDSTARDYRSQRREHEQVQEQMHEQQMHEEDAVYGELAEEEDVHSPAWSADDEMDRHHHHHHDDEFDSQVDEEAASSSACYYSPCWRDPRGSSRGRDY